jgi:DNA mismatch repair protein MutS
MIIFGLNCSGKSSLMKSVGINLILAQAGFYVAAQEFRYYPYDQILTRIISEDNLFKGQSTFEVEMTELRGILSRAKNNRCLVLGDELTHGSETTSGLAIIASAVITLAKCGASFIFTSHLHPLSSMPRIKALPNVRSYHLRVTYDEAKDVLIYDRTLNEGSGQAIYGLEVLRSLHINEEFLELAHKIRREIMEISDSIITMKQSKYNSNLYMNACQICQGPAEDTHHINEQCTANDKGFIEHYHKNVLANLVVLCKKCHLAVHGNSDENKLLKINGYLETSNGPVLDYGWTKKV